MEKTYYELDERTAKTAHEMMSFSEWRSDEPAYRASVDEAWELAEEAAQRDPNKAGSAYALADRYARKYAEWLNEGYRVGAMCPSWMVAGGANFPVRKKQRQNDAMDRHYRGLDAVDAIKDKIRKIGRDDTPIMAGDADALERLAKKVARLEEAQEAMKAANREARSEGKDAPYPSYSLSANRQALNAAKRRLAALEAQKERGDSERTATILGEDVRVVEDVADMRLRLVFDDRPDDDVRDALKHEGFRWSPRNGAWQRQLTENARHALRRLESR